jgi:hypothetical protein
MGANSGAGTAHPLPLLCCEMDATKEEAVPTPLVPPVISLILSISHEESESLPKL